MSNMCQYQLSSDILPSDAPIPPCAATVCERVGNTLDSTATFRPASANWSEQRMPAPPAPTITASNLRRGREVLTAVTFRPSRERSEEHTSEIQSQMRISY